MNGPVFVLGILVVLSPVIAFLQDGGWRADPDDLRECLYDWLGRRSWDQAVLMRGLVLAGFLIMAAGAVWNWR